MVSGYFQFQDTIAGKKVSNNQVQINKLPLAFANISIIYSNEGRMTDIVINQANDKFCRYAELPREFIIGKKISQFSRDFEEIENKILSKTSRGPIEFQPKRYEIFISSQKKWYEIFVDYINQVQATLLIDDCTQRKLKEKAPDQDKKNKSDFLANMSHEIRTPLNGVLGFTEILLALENDERKKSMLELVEDCGNQLMETINDIFNYSNLESGKISSRESEFDPQEIILDTVGYFESAAQKKGLKLSVNVNNIKTNCLVGDYVKLNQVIVNVISNAIKFTDEGKIEIVAVTYKKNNQPHLKLVVADNGIGIEPEQMANIFDEFKQLDHYLTKRIRGTGIGLTITKKIVDFLGGEIHVESKPKNGSTFVIDLPFKESTKKKVEVTKRNNNIKNVEPMKKVKILLAEDNEANQFLIKALTKNTDWELTVVDDGQQAVDAFSNDTFDLILMDVQMPVMNGYDATKIIREMEALKDIHTPIIALTAFAMTSDKDECIKAGMDDYISKPFKRQQFMDTVKDAINSEK